MFLYHNRIFFKRQDQVRKKRRMEDIEKNAFSWENMKKSVLQYISNGDRYFFKALSTTALNQKK